ncbi:hypothetical protein M569_07542, partial [Genlisea aurea]
GLSSKSAFQRHKQWLRHAKTRSARHKIMKFLNEQAALSATEITADSVKEFVSGEVEVGVVRLLDSNSWMQNSSPAAAANEIRFPIPSINGKHSKAAVREKEEAAAAKMIPAANVVSAYGDVLRGLEEGWIVYKIDCWHRDEGNSIHWLSVLCIDRKGMMADITSVLAATGIHICSCAAEIDRKRGVGAMLFRVEAAGLDDLVTTCSKVDLILGVVGWSTGCSWASCDDGFLEC